MRAILLPALCAVLAAEDTPAKIIPPDTDFQSCKITTAVFRIETENTGTPDAPVWRTKAHAHRYVINDKGAVVATLPDLITVDLSADQVKAETDTFVALATKALSK